MHEILTLQLGHRANYLATHFWNTQESYFSYDPAREPFTIDHDINFRAGIGPDGEETYTPRTLIYDLKGGFGGLRKWGGLYDQAATEDATNLWDGTVVKHEDARIPISEYHRRLDEGLSNLPELSSQTVRYWSDFARVFYHPRSIVQINDYELGSTIVPFEKWTSGEDLFSQLDKEHDLLDRDFRVWAEECDHMQGVQIFTGADDAWGGFASKYIENLRDEFGKTCIWVWGLEEEEGQGQRAKQLLRAINNAQSLARISPQTSMYIPLGTPSQLSPYVCLDSGSQWHISALLSLVVESMTLPSRQKLGTGRRGFFSDMELALNANGNQRIASLQSSVIAPSALALQKSKFPNAKDDPRIREADMDGVLCENESEEANSKLDMNFSTGKSSQSALSIRQWEKSNHVFGKVESFRGVSLQQLGRDEEMQLQSRKRRRLAALPVLDKYYTSLGYPLLDSFPKIFRDRSADGVVAVHTSLSTTSLISKRVNGIRNIVTRMADLADREELSNGLGEIGEAYEEGWESGSDDDSD